MGHPAKYLGVLVSREAVTARAKQNTGKWFTWRLTELDRQRATLELLNELGTATRGTA